MFKTEEFDWSSYAVRFYPWLTSLSPEEGSGHKIQIGQPRLCCDGGKSQNLLEQRMGGNDDLHL